MQLRKQMVLVWGIATDFMECDLPRDGQLVSIHGTFTAIGNANLYFGEKEGDL